MQGRKQGAWIKKYPEGAKQYQGAFKDDKPVGKFTYYYEQGGVQTILQYRGDSADANFFHENGKRMGQGVFFKQVKEGLWKFYSKKEVLRSEDLYSNGKKSGLSKVYHDNNKLAEEIHWLDDTKHGKRVKYFQNGTKQQEDAYERGILEGRSLTYYPNGAFKTVGKYSDGIKYGTWLHYHENSKTHFKELYAKGKVVELIKMNGAFKEYYGNDVLKEEVNYLEGKKHGKFWEYYDHGEWKTKLRQAEPEQASYGVQDEMVRYFDGSRLKRRGRYANDQLQGEITNLKLDGTVEKVEFYDKGVKVED